MLKKPVSGVLPSNASSTYPAWGESCLGSSGRVGEKSYASGAFIGCGLAERPF